MKQMILFLTINLAILLSLNAKPKFYLVEIDDENVNPSKVSNETDNALETGKKGESDVRGLPNGVIKPPSRSLTNNTDCGKIAMTRNNLRILGGEQTEENEIPWMCGIMRSNGRWMTCGATLLNCNPVIIVTAAHCITKPNILGPDVQTLNPQSLKVACGAYLMFTYIPSIIDKNEVRLQVTDIVIHPEFTGKMFQPVGSQRVNAIHDIAILKVKNSLACSKGIIYPACLPTKGYEYAGWNSLSSGWGTTTNHPRFQGSLVLLKLRPPIVSDTSCQSICQGQCHIAATQVCAGGEQNKGVCNGDSGGPLVAEDNMRQGWSLVGISSFVRKPCAIEGQYGVFTEVSHYLDWIAEQYGLEPPK